MKVIFFATVIFLINSTFGQSNWQQINVPCGADVNNFFKVSDSIFVCGIQNGSLYRSTNEGKSWVKVFNGNNTVGNPGVRAFIFNSLNEILVGTLADKIRRSTDLGQTWIVTNGGAGDKMVNTYSGVIFGSDYLGSQRLIKSLDSGKTWSPQAHTWGIERIYSMVAQIDTVYFGFSTTIVCSKDFGSTWENFGNPLTGAGKINQIIFINQNEIAAGTDNGFYYSSDRGINWQLRNNGYLPSTKVNNLKLFGDSIYASSSSGIYLTTDKGVQWVHYNNFTIQRDVRNLEFARGNMLAAAKTGIFRIEPDKWINSSNGIYSYSPRWLSTDPLGNIYYNTGVGLFKSSDGGFNWESILPEKNIYGSGVITWKDNHSVLQAGNLSFYYSSDYGSNWTLTGQNTVGCAAICFSDTNNYLYGGFFRYNQGLPPSGGINISSNFGGNWAFSSSYFLSTLKNTQGDTLFGIANNYDVSGILKTNNGMSGDWFQANSGLPTLTVNTMEVDNKKDAFLSNVKGIYKFNKMNSNWDRISDSTLNNVTSIIFSRYNHPIIIRDHKLYASTDFINWSYASDGIDNISAKYIACDSAGYYYAADESGRVYKTLTPYLINRTPISPQLIYPINNEQLTVDTVMLTWGTSFPLVHKYEVNVSLDSVFTLLKDSLVTDTLLILTELEKNKKYFWRVRAFNEVGWSEYSTSQTFVISLTNINEEEKIPSYFSLAQNYPNPFNPSTKISWQSPVSSWQTLKVYDVLGNEVATLVDEYKPLGSYEVEFSAKGGSASGGNAFNLPSGVYFYQLKVGSFVKAKKMILLR